MFQSEHENAWVSVSQQKFFVTDLWGTRFISVGRQWGQTVQQIYKTTHRDLQDTCCCLLQPCYSSWTNIKLMSWALQSQQPHFCCTKQFQPLTSGIISVPVKLSPWVQSTVLQNATVMMFCERLGTRIGKYTARFVSKKDNIHSCVMCRPAAIAGLPKIVKANINVLGLAKLSQTKNQTVAAQSNNFSH